MNILNQFETNKNLDLSDEGIRLMISGNLCRVNNSMFKFDKTSIISKHLSLLWVAKTIFMYI